MGLSVKFGWIGEVERQILRRRELGSNDSELESTFRHLFWIGARCRPNDDGSNSHANTAAAGRGGLGSINKSSNNMKGTSFDREFDAREDTKILNVSYSFFNPH